MAEIARSFASRAKPPSTRRLDLPMPPSEFSQAMDKGALDGHCLTRQISQCLSAIGLATDLPLQSLLPRLPLLRP